MEGNEERGSPILLYISYDKIGEVWLVAAAAAPCSGGAIKHLLTLPSFACVFPLSSSVLLYTILAFPSSPGSPPSFCVCVCFFFTILFDAAVALPCFVLVCVCVCSHWRALSPLGVVVLQLLMCFLLPLP